MNRFWFERVTLISLLVVFCLTLPLSPHTNSRECEECVKIAASWVHLRTCQTCGATLCCDDSPNR